MWINCSEFEVCLQLMHDVRVGPVVVDALRRSQPSGAWTLGHWNLARAHLAQCQGVDSAVDLSLPEIICRRVPRVWVQ